MLSWTLPLSAELPPGDYLRSLHRLALPADVAGRSLNALSNAVELRDLELSWPGNRFEGGRMSESALAALRWAARHPALQRLCTCLGGQPVPAVLLDAVTAAQRANPSLLIHSRSELHEQLLRGTLTYT